MGSIMFSLPRQNNAEMMEENEKIMISFFIEHRFLLYYSD